jgi:hypothetical protein
MEGLADISMTYKYLNIVLREEGEEFLSVLRQMICLDSRLSDIKYEQQVGITFDQHLFVLFSVEGNFNNCLSYMRKTKPYVSDYRFTENSHMIVFYIPDKYINAITKLKQSKYSEMYDDYQLERLFKSTANQSISKLRYMVLTKDPHFKPLFEEIIAVLGEGDNHPQTYIRLPDEAELDFRFEPKREYYNYDA